MVCESNNVETRRRSALVLVFMKAEVMRIRWRAGVLDWGSGEIRCGRDWLGWRTDRSVTLPPPPGRRVPRRNRNTGEGGWAPWRLMQGRDTGEASRAGLGLRWPRRIGSLGGPRRIGSLGRPRRIGSLGRPRRIGSLGRPSWVIMRSFSGCEDMLSISLSSVGPVFCYGRTPRHKGRC